ncbi:MAG: preprotein translocase subunit YajC [Chromatiales bacterium]|jgi:preprotein translocase subunit YajC|nr:preprotein translocase subunit YajC [Chromatiales bacterium]
MDFFISNAHAQEGPAGGGIGNFLFVIVLFAVFYFLLIRPQQKRAKAHQKLIAELKVGDEVVTQGGLLGRISETSDNFLHVELASGVEVKLQRGAVSAVMPKGTIKAA